MLHVSQFPQACDRCYALKERCERSPGAPECKRCRRLQLVCHSHRPFKRPGRRPGRASASSASASASSGDTVATAAASRRPHSSLSGSSASANASASVSASLLRDLDALVLNGTGNQGALAGVDNSSGNGSPEDASRMGYILVDESLIQFIIGPSFCEAHRETLLTQLLSSRSLLQDAYQACALSLPGPGEDASTPLNNQRLDSSYRRASASLSALSNLQVQNTYDMSSCLALGGLLVTFALRLGGEEALTICGRTLSLAKPIYESATYDISSLETQPFLVCIVMTELAECMLRTRTPTLRFRPAPAPCVDPYLGICTTLLPHLHDLALLSFDIANSRDDGSVMNRIDSLETTIRGWRPVVQENLAESCTSTEVCHMFCQAQVMQTAALIITHRLRHPYGTEQTAATAMASSILSQLDMTRLLTDRPPRCIDLPLFVACLELKDDDERSRYIKSTSSIAAFSHLFRDRSQAMLSAAWAARRRQTNLYWWDLGPILASVGL